MEEQYPELANTRLVFRPPPKDRSAFGGDGRAFELDNGAFDEDRGAFHVDIHAFYGDIFLRAFYEDICAGVIFEVKSSIAMTMIEGLFASNVLEAKLPYEPVCPSVSVGPLLGLSVFHNFLSEHLLYFMSPSRDISRITSR